MSQNRADRLEEFIHVHGGQITLGQAIHEGDFSFSYKFTAAVSELRDKLKQKGKTICCVEDKVPTKNIYKIVPIGELPLI